MAFYVYIMASGLNGTLYTGMTDDLANRAYEHANKDRPGFTSRYGVDQLVWFELHDSRDAAFTRERQIKKWERRWKLELIEISNPDWRDLKPDLL